MPWLTYWKQVDLKCEHFAVVHLDAFVQEPVS